MKAIRSESGDNLLEVKGLTIYNRQGRKEKIFLADLNFEVKRGQFIALLGRSGIGKSLIIKALLGLLEKPYWKIDGEIIFYWRKSIFCPITGNPCIQNKFCPLETPSELYLWTKEENGGLKKTFCPLRKLSLFKKEYILKNGNYNKNLLLELRGKKVFTVFQGVDTHLNPCLNISWQIGEVINPQKPWKNTKDEIKRRLKEVQLETDSLKNYPHHFSQGQRQRIMIAMALGHSDLLICDEPTSALDEEVKQKIIDIFRDLRNKREISSMLLITHDLKVVESLFQDDDAIYVLDKERRGEVRIVEFLKVHGLKNGGVWVECRRSGGWIWVNYDHPLLQNRDFIWFQRPKNSKGFCRRKILSVKNLWQGYRHRIWGRIRWILKNVNFEVLEGEFFGIVGKSGCGKTTLAKSIVRLLDNTKGEIYYHHRYHCENLVQIQPNGTKPDSPEMRKLRREIQLIFQDSASIFNPSMTIQELFLETLELLGIVNPKEKLVRMKETLFKLGICENEHELKEVLNKYPIELSGGERQRLAIARTFLLNPRLVIADEPFAEQDKITKEEIIRMMDKMRKINGTTFIIISHELDLMEKICDRIAIIKDGKIKVIT